MSETDKTIMDSNDGADQLSADLSLANARIMMIDDETLNMEVLQIHLEAEGYQSFIMLDDSTQAMMQLREHIPDVLLLDLVMPMVSGLDILREIRLDPQLKHIPTIVLTSSNDSATKLQALQLGATDFLAKPVDASELALRMRNTLSARAYQQRMMHFDPLTALPNRLYYMTLLRRALGRVMETGELAAQVVVNINRFKAVNDSLGPERGDEVLWAFSERLRSAFGAPALLSVEPSTAAGLPTCVARLGGDRFAVLLPIDSGDTERLHLNRCLERFNKSLESPFIIEKQDIYVNTSTGISILSEATASVELLVNDAETAMMHARRRHDTSFAFYSEHMDAKARELLSMESGMRTAVENGQIFLVYQPKVDVETGKILGAEALARWMHPEFGLISPVHFIPVAEDTGMIVSIGEWVLREACNGAMRIRENGDDDFKVAVNVSIRQLHEPDFLTIVKSALEDSGLPPQALIVELTENMIMENAETNVVKLQRLKALGVQISIDDFGTGYSSLSYLQRFPLDQLKIDRSFIREIEAVDTLTPIVKAVISLAHDLGLTVVAEGVETELQLAHIRRLDCEEYQGYLCSKPISEEDFLELLFGDIKKSA